MPPARFEGFPTETLTFLRGLSRNNDKTWFDAHRDDYEANWLEPARRFVVAAGPRLDKVAPGVVADPRVNGSIFRINRDLRFSKDKTPYKDHLDLWFWEGERATAVSGFWLRIDPETVHVGVGAHSFDRRGLAAFRSGVADAETGDDLRRIVRSLERKGYAVAGEHYKRIPNGFDTDDAMRQRLLRHAALHVGTAFPVDAGLHSPRFVTQVVTEWRRMAPLHHWLTATVGGTGTVVAPAVPGTSSR